MSKKPDLEAIYQEAYEAGMAAGTAVAPIPMTVVGGGKSFYVSEGACGFAWINVPGNSAFGKFLKKEKGCRNDYPKGVAWWVGEFNQSMARKEAFAYAAAGVLQKHGIEAYGRSRMD